MPSCPYDARRSLPVAMAVGVIAALALLASPVGAVDFRPSTIDDAPVRAQSAAAAGQVPGRILLRPVSGAAESAVAEAVAAVGGREVDRLDALGVRILSIPNDRVDGALRALNTAPAVAFAERDVVLEAADRVPNDPLYRHQWGAELARMPAGWSRTVGSIDALIAVLDTGVDDGHEDLHTAVTAGFDFVNFDADATDDQGHGTLAAGVAAARSDNTLGIAGVCWRCTILPVKVLDDQGLGAASTIADGIRYAADQGAEVINLSLGSPQRSSTMALAVTYAHDRGSLLVASAGNAGTTDLVYPAAFEGVVAVAGSDELDQRYSWSNHGSWVDVAAPGCNPSTDFDPTRGYSWFCGTSSAAPVVSGIAGLAFSLSPTVTSTDVRSAVRAGTTPLNFVETGRVDAESILAALEVGNQEPAEPTPEPTPEEDDNSVDPAPTPGVATQRLAGPDRFRTAADVSQQTFEAGLQRVYVATGASFPDALSAGAAAAAFDGPVLLTARASLPSATSDELRRLKPAQTVIVGGTSAVQQQVLDAVRQTTATPVRRVSGLDRYATAAAVARDAFPTTVRTVYIATGASFADALGGVAGAAQEDAPLLLTSPTRLPEPTAEALEALQPDSIVVLGGAAAVAADVLTQLGDFAPVTRVSGADRFATAVAVAERVFPNRTEQSLLATGLNFPDALAGGPAAVARGGALLLVRPDRLPEVVADELTRTTPHSVIALGGEQIVAESTLQAAGQAASAGSPE